ncbi:MAG: SURF1 family cytochrome oxidase biogenesis protein, partial [Arenicellales bacterium]
FALLIGLGIWQLQRADEKQAWFDSYRARISEAPIQITARLLGPDRSNFPAEVRGRFDGEGQFLWDNRTHQGQPGFHV